MDDHQFRGTTGRFMYYAPNGDPVSAELAEELLSDADSRRIAWDHVVSAERHEVEVSTVFLVVDHNHLAGPPLLWETIIFGHPDEPMWRYTSLKQASTGHHEICGLIRDYGLNMDLWPEPGE